MRYCARTGERNPYAHYMCGKYKDFQTRGCTTHYIRYDALYAYVLVRIQHWSARAIQDEDILLNQLLSAGDREGNTAQKKQVAELKKAAKRKTEVDGLFVKLYEESICQGGISPKAKSPPDKQEVVSLSATKMPDGYSYPFLLRPVPHVQYIRQN